MISLPLSVVRGRLAQCVIVAMIAAGAIAQTPPPNPQTPPPTSEVPAPSPQAPAPSPQAPAPSPRPAAANPYTPVAPMPIGDILLTIPSSHIPDVGTAEVRFTHRFYGSVDEGGALHSLFGLDRGANVGIALSYVPFRDFQVALARVTSQETLDLSAKYIVMQQAHSIPFSAALRGGVDYRVARAIDDRSSLYVQAIISRQFGQRVDIYAAPTYVTKAGRVATGTGSSALFSHAFNVPVGAAVMVLPAFSIVGEVFPPNRDLPSGNRADLGWSFGVKKAIGGHFFEILLTNNTAMTPDQYISSTFNGAPLSSRDKRLGFNIERRFGKRR